VAIFHICFIKQKTSNAICVMPFRSSLLSGIDPLLISCWACLSHDLYSVLEKQASISVSELLEQIHVNAKELHEAAVLHKKQFVDGGVPVAPCLTNLIMPILQAKLPEKMVPRLQKRACNEKESATETSEGTAKRDAVGRATAQEEEKNKDNADELSQTPNKTPKRRWQTGVLQPTANRKAVAPKAKVAGPFARRVRLHNKTKDQQSASKGHGAPSAKPRRKPTTAKTRAAKKRKSNLSSSKGSKAQSVQQVTE
jgi:hypothetical protein